MFLKKNVLKTQGNQRNQKFKLLQYRFFVTINYIKQYYFSQRNKSCRGNMTSHIHDARTYTLHARI